MQIFATLERLRRALLSRNEDPGWEPFLWLTYLALLFVPLARRQADLSWLWPTLFTIPLFLGLYFRQYRQCTRASLPGLLAIAGLGYALTPINPFAMTYLTYCAAFAPFVFGGLLRPLLLTAALVGLYAVEIFVLDQPRLPIGIAAFVCAVVCIGNSFTAEKNRKNAALKLSQDEVRRLAALAERERIGRDLHDLLGHTLSLIAIKSELAGRLIHRDSHAAAREVADVTDVARQALKQVRTAVSGIRAAALDVELLSARALLESSGIALTCHRDSTTLPVEIETSLAMMLREAVTNIHKHARAQGASIEVRTDNQSVSLIISDDGRGGIVVHGNGLTGVSERAQVLGGSLHISSASNAGTVLSIRLPLHSSAIQTQSKVDASIGTNQPEQAVHS